LNTVTTRPTPGWLVGRSMAIQADDARLSRLLQLGRVRYMRLKPWRWHLLITNLPGANQTLRMRLWRALKASGAGSLRDGVYVLPASPTFLAVFEQQAREIRAVAGSVHILHFEADSAQQQGALTALFDRTADYQEFIARLDAWKKKLPKFNELEARKALAVITREAATVAETDLFPGQPQAQMHSAIAGAEAAANARFSPNEPRPAHRKIPRRQLEEFQGKTWATREHMWIDRVCSAWLIRRFIDPKAKLVWFKHVKHRPKKALGFDFDGAEFTHVDSKVTFEVLVTSFGLDNDVALARLGSLVHFLDVGGIPVAEAPGFAAIVAGARSIQPDDQALLHSITPVLDSLYQSFGIEKLTV
jgi:hypothetical protein